MAETKWEIGPVELIGGQEAIIDAINEDQEDFRYTGRARSTLGHMVSTGWHANGRYMYAETDHGYNLAPPPKKTVRVQVCLLVYEDGSVVACGAKDEADTCAQKGRFAWVEIDREVTRGEGL